MITRSKKLPAAIAKISKTDKRNDFPPGSGPGDGPMGVIELPASEVTLGASAIPRSLRLKEPVYCLKKVVPRAI